MKYSYFSRIRTCFKWGPSVVAALIAISLGLAVFAGLAIDVVENQAIFFDAAILNALFAIASPVLTRLMEFFSTSATEWFLAAAFLVLAVIWWRQRRADILALFLAILGSAALNQFVKAIFQRARPTLHPALVHASGFSFPSGHSTAAIAFYGTLAYLLARRAAPQHRIWYYLGAAVWILFVGLSRNYLEVHYPSDVLAAFAVTLPWVLAVIFAHNCLTAAAKVAQEAGPPEPGSNSAELS